MVTPQVSVLLATYHPRWFHEALRSALDQDFTELEVLVLDDANSARTRVDVEEIGDPRIRYLPNASPLGPAGNHSRGLAEARGRYIGILNHDDRWKPHLVSTLLAALESHPDAVVAFSPHDCIDGNGDHDPEFAAEMDERYGRSTLAPGLHRPFIHLAVSGQTVPVAQSALWLKSACPSIPARIYGAYDWWIGYRLSRSGAGAVFVDERLAEWRIHPANLTSTFSFRKAMGTFWTLRDIAHDPAVGSEHGAIRSRYRRYPLQIAAAYARSLKPRIQPPHLPAAS
jgi:glycosyltransferase involved in cell wall biosynthesis